MPVKVEPGELLRRATDSRAADIWTSFPAKIVSYDNSTDPPTADVQPVFRRPVPSADLEGDWETEDLPVIPNVPILFPRGGNNAYTITWPITVGDWVAVHVSIYSFAGWRQSGQVSDPGDLRPHALGNCFAVPGMVPNGPGLSQVADSALVLEGPVIKIGKDATDFIALASKVTDNLTAIQAALNSATAPSMGGPVTYTSPYTPSAVAATKAKAK